MEEVKQLDKKMTQSRLANAEYGRVIYQAVVENHVTREDILKPAFWSLVALQLKPGYQIEVTPDDMSFYALLRVRACDRTWAQVDEIIFKDFSKVDVDSIASQNDEYEYKFRGPHCLHSIVRKADGSVLFEKCATKQEALDKLANHIKTIAA